MEILKLKSFGGSIDDNKHLSPHFRAREFACEHGLLVIDEEFIDDLESFRNLYGRPFIVTCGFRCSICNSGCHQHSYHTLGRAVDGVFSGVSPINTYTAWLGDLQWYQRLGLYKSHLHFDNGNMGREHNLLPLSWWVIDGVYYYITDVMK